MADVAERKSRLPAWATRVVEPMLRSTIWAPNAIPAAEYKYRNLKRVLLPLIDVAFFLIGIAGALNTVPALSAIYPDNTVDTIMYLFASAAAGAFMGVAFPKLWALELGSKAVILASLIVYGIILGAPIYAPEAVGGPPPLHGGPSGRVYLLAFVIIPVGLVIWRMSLLGGEWQDRRQAKLVKKAITAHKGAQDADV